MLCRRHCGGLRSWCMGPHCQTEKRHLRPIYHSTTRASELGPPYCMRLTSATSGVYRCVLRLERNGATLESAQDHFRALDYHAMILQSTGHPTRLLLPPTSRLALSILPMEQEELADCTSSLSRTLHFWYSQRSPLD